MNRAIAEACQTILARDLGEKTPVIPRGVFYKVAAEIETEIRNDAQDLLEV